MFDVFYWGDKPNLFAFEQPAVNFEEAVAKCKTEFFWFIYGGNDYTNFDFGFVPPPWEAQHTHVWPSQWQKDGGVYLAKKGSSERSWNFHSEQKVRRLPDKENWYIPDDYDTEFDFSWHPDPHEPPYEYHFSSQWQRSSGIKYIVPNNQGVKFVDDFKISTNSKVDIFFIDYGNPLSQVRFERIKEKHPQVQRTRFFNDLFQTVKRCAQKTKTGRFWIISSQIDYSDFDFDWHSESWQTQMIHVFGSQWQKWTDTFLISTPTFLHHASWCDDLTKYPDLNFVSDQLVKVDQREIYLIDHLNGNNAVDEIREQVPTVKVTRFVESYLETLKRIVNTVESEYIWVISSVCDYSKFDFSWHPEPWQKEMIHVFPNSIDIKYGDTFYIHIESFKKQMYELELLDWFNVINYCQDQSVERRSIPVHVYESDNLVNEIKNYDFTAPYVLFTNQPDLQIRSALPLWSQKDRVVERISASGATSIVPRDVKGFLTQQMYDYPYLQTSKHKINDYYLHKNFPALDIVYISNGEPDEEKWYDHLCYMSNSDSNNIPWIRGINGRTAAYQAAARASNTPWFFAVFAKLEVVPDFDWRWMPDYWQEPKHYIFNSRNPLNGLEYGHQGAIAYNKRMVLENNNPGIDFTMSQAHEVVPLLSGIAHFNQSAWMTWRTAFREVLKLKMFLTSNPTVETEHRINVWLTRANGNYADWCIQGAQDAVEYFNLVDGNADELKKSYEWNWLSNYAQVKHNLTVDQ